MRAQPPAATAPTHNTRKYSLARREWRHVPQTAGVHTFTLKHKSYWSITGEVIWRRSPPLTTPQGRFKENIKIRTFITQRPPHTSLSSIIDHLRQVQNIIHLLAEQKLSVLALDAVDVNPTCSVSVQTLSSSQPGCGFLFTDSWGWMCSRNLSSDSQRRWRMLYGSRVVCFWANQTLGLCLSSGFVWRCYSFV